MRTSRLRTALLLMTTLIRPAFAQQAGTTLTLTVDEALRMAADHNVDLAADRFGPQISDTQVAAAHSAFRPVLGSSLQRNNQLQPPSSFLTPTATRTDAVTSSVSLNQRLPRFGTSYSVAWNSAHTDSNSFLSSYNPLVQSGLALNLSQPLFRNLSVDSARLQQTVAVRNRDISDLRLRESVVQTTSAVKSTYWNLYAAAATVDARRSSLHLAEELARVNQVKVDVGQSPPLDLASALAEVASNQEQLIIAETAVREAEDQLRVLIFDPTRPESWAVTITPVDTPPVATVAVDLDSAVATALRERTDLVRARRDLDNAQSNLAFATNQQLPDVRVNAGYQTNGLGGTEVLRSGGFPGTVVGPGQVTAFGSVLDQVLRAQYPTWTLGVSVSYPLGQSSEQAALAKSRLDHDQAAERIKSSEGKVIQQVRTAARKIEMNAKRIDVARTARVLAEQRLDAEQKRFDVGLSTNFLVIQAQRDLAQAKTNELSAILAYDLALVEFESVQQAPPAGSGGASGSGSASASTAGASSSARPATGGSSTGTSSAVLP